MRSPVRVMLELSRRPMPVLTVALAGLLSLVQIGCSSRSAPVPISGVEVLEHTPTIAVDVENVRGAVLIRVNNKLTAPRIVANAGTQTGEPVENYQGGKWVTAQITETDGRAVLSVRNTVHENESDRWVQVAIEVPSCDGLRIKNSDGAIDVRGVNGAITIENGGAGRPGGYIYVATGKPATSPISLTTPNGDIDLILPTDSTGNIELTSGNGRLAAIVAWTGQVTNSVIKPGQYSGLLNWGTNPIRAKTGEGEVRLHVGPYRFGNPHIRYYNSWWFSLARPAPSATRPA
ncbi:MAG: hypothetical protein JNM86_09860 [Phycisphaerae bacterium]|nr:hypothetical protein [Phycisphaerae bacterium]